ncbi:kinase-like domain-containing protein [Obelidium mucronatum]|nr:kinase-like domain-containing protein [Obelidium mucronatum]
MTTAVESPPPLNSDLPVAIETEKPEKPRRLIELESVQTITGTESDDETEEVIIPIRQEQLETTNNATKPKRIKVIFGTWILGKTVGTGSSCTVKVVTHKDIGKKCVVKSIRRQAEDSSSPHPVVRNKDGIALREHFMIREALVCVSLDHPNILKMHSYVIGKNHFYFFFEHLEGMDLGDFITERGRMNEPDARFVFKQILSAVEYTHKCNVIHRDLKLENIRIHPVTLKAHLLDYGFGTFYSPKFKQHSSCGSPCYASPEIYLHKPYRGPEVDVWSLGVCLYGMIASKLPFEKDSFDDLHECVVSGEFYMPEYASRGLQSLLTHMLQVDPIHRISIVDISNSPWILNDTNCLKTPQGILQPQLPTPVQRIKAIYRSSADVALGTLFRKRPAGGSALERGRGVATASGVAALLKPTSTSASLAGNVFATEWVEDVLRMERHTRAEFLLRELERRAVQRKWSLERQWRAEGHIPPQFESGDIVVSTTKKAEQMKQKRRSGIKTFVKLTESLMARNKPVAEGTGSGGGDVAVMGTPTPVRTKKLIDRVFRRPMNSPLTAKTGIAESESSKSGVWGNNSHVLPLSFASRWNIRSEEKEGQEMEPPTEKSTKNANVKRLFRKWSTIPAFVEESNSDPVEKQPQSVPGTSHITLCEASSGEYPETNSQEDTPDFQTSTSSATNTMSRARLENHAFLMPNGIVDWWRKRFELEGVMKSKRQDVKRQSELNVTQSTDDFDTENESDAESFECIEPKARQSIYQRLGWKLKL